MYRGQNLDFRNLDYFGSIVTDILPYKCQLPNFSKLTLDKKCVL